MRIQSGRKWLIAIGVGLVLIAFVVILVRYVAENFPWSGLDAD